MIDYHCHLLPGIDDGAPDLDSALAMARQLAAAGFTRVYCTPHRLRGLYDNTPAQVRRATAELQDELARAGIALELAPGMEYFLDEFFLENLADPLPLGESGLLLFEVSPRTDPAQIRDAVFEIQRRGLTPLLAHPERYPLLLPAATPTGLLKRLTRRLLHKNADAFDNDPLAAYPLFQALCAMGCRMQGNLGSFTGYYGRDAARAAQLIQSAQAFHVFGSDGHSPTQLRRILEQTDILRQIG